MVFELNRAGAAAPLYEQIKQRISEMIEGGSLRPGDRLAATRDLARDLAVNRNTVVKAYEELEIDGLVRSGVGQGTFVAEFARPAGRPRPEPRPATAEFEGLWARAAADPESMEFSELFFRVSNLHKQGVTALSSCMPDKALFPMLEFRKCAYYALQNWGADLLDIGVTQGFVPLLEQLPRYLLRHGLSVEPNHLVMTSGIQQGIDLVARALVNPGDVVVTEEFTYPRAISVLRAAGAELLGIPLDRDGMKVEVLEQVLARRRAKLIYTIPSFQNPTGTTLSEERRRRLLELSALHKIPILEDHYANDLRVEGPAPLPLAAMDRQGWVIAVGSLSKVLFHGLRLGWIITPLEAVRRRLISLKQNADLQTSYLTQGIVLEFMRRGYLEKYLKRRLAQVRARRQAVRQALTDYMPEGCWWYEVAGGVCYWLNLPPPVRADELLLEARKRGIVFTPKHLFSVKPSLNDALRLGFTDLEEDRARNGLRLLGQLVRRLQSGSRPPPVEATEYARVHV